MKLIFLLQLFYISHSNNNNNIDIFQTIKLVTLKDHNF